jgi:hypothetical protein
MAATTNKKEIIAILSMSFSGSTLTCGLLNNIPGCVGLGETHWFVDQKNGFTHNGIHVFCTRCGRGGCDVYDKIDKSTLNDRNLYNRLFRHIGCKYLGVGDKASNIYQRFMNASHGETFAMRNDLHVRAIVLFKRPEAMALSNHRHRNVWGEKLLPENWYKNQQQRLWWAKKYAHEWAVVEYEKLTTDTEGTMARLCDALRLPRPTGPIQFPVPGDHNILGNNQTYINERYKKKTIRVDDRWKTLLPKDELAAIRKDAECQRVWRMLQRLSV